MYTYEKKCSSNNTEQECVLLLRFSTWMFRWKSILSNKTVVTDTTFTQQENREDPPCASITRSVGNSIDYAIDLEINDTILEDYNNRTNTYYFSYCLCLMLFFTPQGVLLTIFCNTYLTWLFRPSVCTNFYSLVSMYSYVCTSMLCFSVVLTNLGCWVRLPLFKYWLFSASYLFWSIYRK